MARYKSRSAVRKPTKATKKAVRKARGGFFVPINQYVMRDANDAVAQFFMRHAWSAAKRKTGMQPHKIGAAAGLMVGRYISKLEAQRVSVDIEGTKYQKIATNDYSQTGKSSQTTLSKTTNTTSKSQTSHVRAGQMLRTKLETGKPSSSSVIRANKQNGSRIVTLRDTRTQLSGTDPGRGFLSQKFGFNQRKYAMYSSVIYPRIADLDSLYSISSKNITDLTRWDVSVYGNIEWMKQGFTATNTNSFLDVELKVHWCTCSNPAINPYVTFQNSFNPTYPDAPVFDTTGLYPDNLTFSARTGTGGETSVLVDPYLGNLNSSDIFENEISIRKTFTKRLKPGDVWSFEHKHNMGSGCRIDIINTIYKDGINSENDGTPVSLFPIFEMKGRLVDAYNSANKGLRYTGTAPGGVQFEFMKSAKVGLPSQDVYATQDSIYEVSNVGTRTYIKKFPGTIAPSQRFNVNADKIIQLGQTAAEDKYIIPVTSDSNQESATAGD